AFYYLGLLLGNQIINPKYSLKSLAWLYAFSIILQIVEGYEWLQLGVANCGTQIKLTTLLTSTIFLFIVYAILNNPNIDIKSKFLRSLGDYSFGIYLCHIMIMMFLEQFHYYTILPYPISSAIVILISWGCCYIGYRICGKKASEWIGFK
ncbi:MAG: acyltransferase family protein, partial [Bacteroidaceae bacterium]|nr:acyltransferase family protein [Bacteroidaceae bacterium]